MTLKVIVWVSLLLNAVLIAGYYVRRSPTEVISKGNSGTVIADDSSKKHRTNQVVQTVVVDRENDFDWASVESDDYREYIGRLRAIGCPEQTVRDIIIADINKLYGLKMAALYPAPKDIKFWRVEDRVVRNEERERNKKRNELENEKHALIKELLGIDYDVEMARNSGRPTEDEMRYGFLSQEKQEQTKALREKYREMERFLFKDGEFTAENRTKFMALRAEREAEIAMLLGPEDFEQYELRNSRTARNMRENLSGFEPTEEEFRKIFKTQKVFDDQFAFSRDGGDEAAREERKLAQAKLDEQLRSVLGEERYHDYQMSLDDRFRESFDFAQQYNLPKEKAQALYDVRVAAEKEIKRIQRDSNLTPEARNLALQSINQDTKAALGVALGPDISQNYFSRSKWLNSGVSNNTNSRDRRDRGDRGPMRRGS